MVGSLSRVGECECALLGVGPKTLIFKSSDEIYFAPSGVQKERVKVCAVVKSFVLRLLFLPPLLSQMIYLCVILKEKIFQCRMQGGSKL